MKKLLTSLIAIAGLISATAFAQPTTGYTSTQLPGHAKAALSPKTMPTNIVILNESDYYIHAVIPNAGIDQPINSGNTGLITHPSYSGDTNLLIEDGNNNVLFNVIACHRAVLTVYGGPSVFSLDVERKFC